MLGIPSNLPPVQGLKKSGQISENKSPQFTTVSVSNHQLNQASLDRHITSYETACALIDTLKQNEIEANITAGGVAIHFKDEQTEKTGEVLKQFGITKVSDRTFHEELVMEGGLIKAATKDPTGRAMQILKIISGTNN